MEMKHVLILKEPTIMDRRRDGSIGTTMRDNIPFVCPRCHGTGKMEVTDIYNGEVTIEPCDLCLGYGELEAEVTVDWKPRIRKEQPL